MIDDGIATGSTMKSAVMALKQHNASYIIIAVPVAPPTVFDDFKDIVDNIVCLKIPEYFYAVGQAYAAFPQTSDAEVLDLLK